jgi:drug/metabolite transporter (DMT)-like permease
MLKEKITTIKILAVIGAFIGVLLFTQDEISSNEASYYYYIGVL